MLVLVFTNQKKYEEDYKMVIAFSLYTLLAYKRLHRNALLLDRGGTFIGRMEGNKLKFFFVIE